MNDQKKRKVPLNESDIITIEDPLDIEIREKVKFSIKSLNDSKDVLMKNGSKEDKERFLRNMRCYYYDEPICLRYLRIYNGRDFELCYCYDAVDFEVCYLIEKLGKWLKENVEECIGGYKILFGIEDSEFREVNRQKQYPRQIYKGLLDKAKLEIFLNCTYCKREYHDGCPGFRNNPNITCFHSSK